MSGFRDLSLEASGVSVSQPGFQSCREVALYMNLGSLKFFNGCCLRDKPLTPSRHQFPHLKDGLALGA